MSRLTRATTDMVGHQVNLRMLDKTMRSRYFVTKITHEDEQSSSPQKIQECRASERSVNVHNKSQLAALSGEEFHESGAPGHSLLPPSVSNQRKCFDLKRMDDFTQDRRFAIITELRRCKYSADTRRKLYELFRSSEIVQCVLEELEHEKCEDKLVQILEGYGHLLKHCQSRWLLDDITMARDDITQSQDDITHSQDDITHSQDDITKPQDDITISRDDITKPQDDITISQDDITHSQDDITQSQDEITQSQDDITQPKISKYYVNLLSKLVSYADLPIGKMNQDEAYNEDKFDGIPQKASVAMEIITSVISAIFKISMSHDDVHWRKEFMNSVITNCVTIAATHAEKHQWSNKTTVQQSQELQKAICQVCSCDTIQELLSGPTHTAQEDTKRIFEKGIFGKILTNLRPILARETWKLEPRSRHVFKWCMSKVKHPYLGDYLDKVLPPSLLFVDDYQVDNKILGIQCLHHIISNVDPTQLKWYGTAMVIYEALQKHIYSQEVLLLDVLYPCLIGLLKVIERSPRKTDQSRKANRYDELFQITLTNMEFEQKIVLRRVYSKYLYLFIENMGITVIRHYKKLLQVITGFLEVYDGPDEITRLNILKLLRMVTMETWPRISHHINTLLKSLLRLMYDVVTDRSSTSEEVKQKLLEGAVDCLVLLRRCCRDHVDTSLKDVLSVIDNETLSGYITNVLQNKQSELEVS
ncbi:TELO2-interacting protein 2-like [Glandiceps talaboti]